ncbi:hypothetical protein [Lentilactobacillus sp. SPB1-3]|uniref:Uncharacterized protein n=1 Tax=Lentilactobacillus terminaliae TaxID=3003483 RepID=A0ACD5DDX3_9LACO|nr:hypothetical protein [Lentilactobacillus sp. SPB1-3]MCZ0978022.1 hypothetical protein [Lentilactobacillus sp. SPB1-3]
MINSIFSNIDHKETIKQARALLKRYPMDKLMDQMGITAKESFTSISAQQYDGMPSSQDNANHEESKMVKELKDSIQLHYKLVMIEKTIESMNITDRQNYYAHILTYRYLKEWSVPKCCDKLAEKFPEYASNGFLPESTFHDHKNEALLVFANIYNGGKLLVQKSSE